MKTKQKKTQIKLLLMILVLCLLLSACGRSSNSNLSNNHNDYHNTDSTSDDVISDESNNELLHKTEVPEGYIGIYTVEDLINSSKNTSANYIVMNDLDLSSVSDWEGIKNEGIFDGNNYVISNLKSTSGGLFSVAESLHNFKLEEINIEVNISPEAGKKYSENIGGLVDAGRGNVYNCSVSGEITLSTNPQSYTDMFLCIHYPESEFYYVGGIMGKESTDASISYCINYCNIFVKNNGDTTPTTRVGGIVGSDSSTVSDCKNYGKIELEANDSQKAIAGGICGTAVTCYRNSNHGEIFSVGLAGGIIGCAIGNTVRVEDCYNSGNITSRQHQSLNDLGEAKGSCVGGIVGYKNYITDDMLISSSYNVGQCSGADNCGEIVGGRYDYSGLDIKYCAYLAQDNLGITGDNAMFADNKAMTLEKMKDLNNYPFDNKDAWENGTGDYPYPVLK